MPMLLESLKDREMAHEGRRFILRGGREDRSEAVIECLKTPRGTRRGVAVFQERVLDACVTDLLGDSGPYADDALAYALAYFYDRATEEAEGVKIETSDRNQREEA
jgi:hypothetical protein